MINEELINNMYKYTTGEFLTFKEAKKALTLNETLKGKAFIVGYKDGNIDLVKNETYLDHFYLALLTAL